MKLFEITQPKNQTQTDVGTENLDSLFNDFLTAAEHNHVRLSPKQKQKTKQVLAQKVASGEATREKLNNLSSPNPAHMARAMRHLIDLAAATNDAQDIISDDQARRNAGLSDAREEVKPQIVTPETLPAVVNKDMAAKGANIEPEWTMVKHLPGYLQQGIRAMGRQVFNVFTNTPIEDINLIANIKGMGGPNEMREINAVANYLKTNGHRQPVAHLDFGNSMPGYEADVIMYEADGVSFMMVEDFMGRYIYSWPSAHTITHKEDQTAMESYIFESKAEKLMGGLAKLAKFLQRHTHKKVDRDQD